MELTELKTRANGIEAAVCNRLGITSEEYLVTFFETGCELVERFFKSNALEFQDITTLDFMKSNLFWYWWANKFLRAGELFLHTLYEKKNVFEAFISKAPWPPKELCDMIIQEIKQKKVI